MSDATVTPTQTQLKKVDIPDISAMIRDVIILSGIDYDTLDDEQKSVLFLEVIKIMSSHVEQFVVKYAGKSSISKLKAIIYSNFDKKIVSKYPELFNLISLGMSDFVQTVIDKYDTDTALEEIVSIIKKEVK